MRFTCLVAMGLMGSAFALPRQKSPEGAADVHSVSAGSESSPACFHLPIGRIPVPLPTIRTPILHPSSTSVPGGRHGNGGSWRGRPGFQGSHQAGLTDVQKAENKLLADQIKLAHAQHNKAQEWIDRLAEDVQAIASAEFASYSAGLAKQTGFRQGAGSQGSGGPTSIIPPCKFSHSTPSPSIIHPQKSTNTGNSDLPMKIGKRQEQDPQDALDKPVYYLITTTINNTPVPIYTAAPELPVEEEKRQDKEHLAVNSVNDEPSNLVSEKQARGMPPMTTAGDTSAPTTTGA
ncbi:uncharacterized protein N7498_007112 [Penicillium cinerascens]|uniref:Uncharacterized protein n=1 Tax=Penicillium cinerascens TaxID=70096 RepID=A0A9W9MD21_9EURO|nr:uncharacterized protein N7498_007112 [Penicillium cinerascens]KAJ5197995.1 hypothetical protein N7498_007112 [Penicillium cinerascens]